MMEFKHRQLKNGLTVIGEVNPAAQSAAVGFFVRTGSRDETPEVSGVSHFLEHMLFKGTERLSALDVNEAFDRLGAKFNAFTSEENTVFYAAVLPEYLPAVSQLWLELMRPSLRDDDFNIEKHVILEEIAMYRDMPQYEVMDQGRALHFGIHPCGNSVLGSDDSIKAMTAQQMRAYFQQRYAPNNMVLACCGRFDFDQLCELAEAHSSAWKPVEAQRRLFDFEGTFQVRHVQNPNLARHHICLLGPAVSMQDPRRYAASLLASIVGDDTGSRYYWALTETALAETAVMQCESMDGTGAFYSYFSCDPKNAEKVIETVKSVYKDLAETGLPASEIEAARNKILTSLTLKCEQPMGRLVSLGFNWVYNHQYRSVQNDVDDVKSVRRQEIQEMIALKLGRFTQFSLGPLPA
ncbi:MAG: insulinase family protein [Planctomycetaceae bacterium]|nr:insulinase family protein [Planctomycetaceae bacterium]